MEYPIGDRKTTQETGKLTFTKSFSGVNENQVSGISFTVKNIDSNKVIGTYGLEHMKNTDGSYSKKLENLPVGEYTVTENNADVAGYTVVTAYKVNEKDSENGTVEVVKDTANTVDVTNTYTKDVGSLTFKKTFAGAELTEEQTAGISFTVTGPDEYSQTFALSDIHNEDGSYSKKLENLPVGEYTVTENNADVAGYTVVTAYKVNEKDSENGTVEVVKDTANTVDVTNTYTKLVSYTVKKVWNDGGVANVVFPESLDVTLTANGEKVADRDDATYVLNASNEWSYTWNELPENDANGNKINYSVVEADIDGVYLTLTIYYFNEYIF